MQRSVRFSASVMVALLCGGGLARAVEFAPREPSFPPRDYTCRFEGENLPLGAVRCLRTPQGQRVAECVVVLNMSSWHATPGSCPSGTTP